MRVSWVVKVEAPDGARRSTRWLWSAVLSLAVLAVVVILLALAVWLVELAAGAKPLSAAPSTVHVLDTPIKSKYPGVDLPG